MKMVCAVIRPEMFDSVKAALEADGIYGMTVGEVMGRGAQRGIALKFRGKVMPVELIPKVKIEMVVSDADVEKVIGIIRANGRTGKPGDGRIFVLPVETICRVRTDLEDPTDP
ncbi:MULTISPECIES: P-II family nitrogen regulator [unclassified Methanoculleus]|uniref:P-II family nitrogen regulator n=1 Tax=unclassified Methanoculleus TaxID=2619537 RepID=UPI0025D09A64|nr:MULTISPECIES: P-II family nitrogen regulator [unclassified Methanoculleus]MCK9318689.1 P-II family nitrogen regulator [Methanoculleus sp.]MDD2254456.1 P-II family nitrogen regulator [Methanoculleus sp.]MDD2787393.1 P-II family nitrogen regulator [Methanoculleus sp.]MDD3216697.1 P-II family nitrogen regulator [Methanoculleus sp.]MDD4315064.1 P-II family nitrogen regulator [Methanoculleus sp.]